MTSPWRRWVTTATIALSTLVVSALGTVVVPDVAGAVTLTPLTAQAFTANSVPENQWVLPGGSDNGACLTASPDSSSTSIPNCSDATDASGDGALRLTTNAGSQVGSVFNTTSLPTSQGLDVTFNTYQFDGTSTRGADGISFALAATDPSDPQPPTAEGAFGGGLGYSINGTDPGLPDGYLGFGLDVFGNYLNADYGGGCGDDGDIDAAAYPQSVTVRGPGDGVTGYCIQATTASTTSPSSSNNLPGGTGALDNKGATARSSSIAVPVEIALNPSTSSATTPSGLVVPGGEFAVEFTPIGGTAHTVTGQLPDLVGNTLGIPSSWYNPTTGVPYQMVFGWTASTGGSNEYHEVDSLASTTVNGQLPVLSLDDTDNASGVLKEGASGTQVTLSPSLAGASQDGADESNPPTVTDTFPTGVVPGTPTGTDWDCSGSSGQVVSCTYDGSEPVDAGSSYPSIEVPVTVTTGASVGSGSDDAEVSSIDASPSRTADSFTVEDVPSAPTVVSATASDGGAVLTVDPPTQDGDSPVTGYVVTPLIGGVAQSPIDVASASSTIDVSGLDDGTAYTFEVAAVNAVGTGAHSVGSGSVTPNDDPSITTQSIAQAEAGAHYHQALGTSGGTQPFTWTLSSGSLPAGISLDPTTGVISGSTSTTGSSDIVAEVTDADGNTATMSYTLVVGPDPAITTTSLAAGDVNENYTSAGQVVESTGGSAPDTWSISSGSLPTGLSLDASTGAIAGTISGSATTQTFTVQCEDANGMVASQSLTLTVHADPSITTPTLPAADVGAPFSELLVGANGTSPYTWSVAGGSLPPGLTLDPTTGVVSGTPTGSGTSTFTVAMVDATGTTASKSYSITVDGAPAITTSSLPGDDTGSVYDQSLGTTGGTAPFAFAVTSGSLPPGLSLDPATGVVSGTPTGPGTSTFTVAVTDAVGGTADQAYSVTIAPTPTVSTTALAGADRGAPYSEVLVPGGGTGPYTWSIVGGSLPAGLTLDPATGLISGAPTGATSTFTVQVTDADGDSATQLLTFPVNPDPTITTTTLPSAQPGAPLSETLTTSGGTGPFTWTVTSGALPAGLTLDPTTGVISGTPTGAGGAFAVTVTDASHRTSSESYAWLVGSSPVISTTSLAGGLTGVTYTQPLAGVGGAAPYHWSVALGSLPAGLTLDPTTGVISGVPLDGGTALFYAGLTDANGATAYQLLSITVLPSVLNSRSIAATADGKGYWIVGDNARVLTFGDARFYGPPAIHPLNKPIVGIAATADGKGYWLVASDGGVLAFGDAHFYGSMGGHRLNQPILGMAATPDGKGYWLVASDGGVFSFGDARFHGSTGNLHLDKPVVGMAATPDGGGYWLVASDGGLFAFGDAGFHGSMGGKRLNGPVVGMAATPDGQGYWMVASDGGIFSFGDARYHGNTLHLHLNRPITGMQSTPDGSGYWMAAADGGIFSFGDAGFFGSGSGKLTQLVP